MISIDHRSTLQTSYHICVPDGRPLNITATLVERILHTSLGRLLQGLKKDLTSASFTTCPCCAKGRRYFTRLSLERMLRRKSMKKTESGIPHGIKSMNSIYCSITGETMQCTHAQLFE